MKSLTDRLIPFGMTTAVAWVITGRPGLAASIGVPEDPHDAKLVGLYPRIQDGRWLQRVKIPGAAIVNMLSGRRFGPAFWREA